MPKFSEWLFGKKGKVKQAKTISPMQEKIMELINQGIVSGEGPLKDIFGEFDQAAFEKGVSEPALKNFRERLLPMLQEKFIAGGQVGGSGMMREQARAATDLQSQLAQLMYGAQQKQKEGRLTGLQNLLSVKPFENMYRPSTKGALQGAIEGISPLAGQMLIAGASGGLSPTGSGGMNQMATNARNVTQAVVG